MAEDGDKKRRSPARRPLKILAYVALALIGLLIVLAVAVAALLGTESGRLWLLDTGTGFGLGEGPVQVQLENPRSPALGEWHFDRVLVTRDGDNWIDARELYLHFQPGELLDKRLLVESLEMSRLDFFTDAGSPAPDQPEPKAGGLKLPPIAVRHFALDRLNIVDPAREIPEYQITGDLALFWNDLPLQVDLRAQSSGPDTEPAMQLVLQSRAETREQLQLRGSLEEQAGGWIGELLRLPPNAPIDASFAAQVSDTDSGYQINLERLQLPFLQHQLGVQGQFRLGPDLQQLTLDNLILRTDEHEHQLAGSLTQQQIDLNLELNRLPLDLISPWVEQVQSGHLSAQLHATGPPTDPRVQGHLSATSAYRGKAVELELAGNFSREQLIFDDLAAQFGRAQLQAAGRLDLTGDGTDLSFSATDLPVDYLRLFDLALPEALSGRLVSAEGSLSGNYRDPTGQISAQAEGQYQGQPFALKLDASGDRGRVQLQPLALTVGDASALAEGVLDLQGQQTRLDIQLDSLPVSLAEVAGVELPPQLDARINGSARLLGSLSAPRGLARLNADGHYRDQPFSVTLVADGNQQAATLQQARVALGDALLSMQGTFDIAARRVNLEANLDRAPLSLLELAQIEPPDGLTAQFSGSAGITGNFSSPQVVTQIRAEGQYQELPFNLMLDGSYRDRRAEFEQVRLTIDGNRALQLSGFWQPDRYDLALAVSDLPTRTLSALGWDLVTGNFNGELHLRGTPQQPDIEGQFIYEGSLRGLDLATGDETRFDLGWETRLMTTEEQRLLIESDFTRDQRETGSFEISLPITRYLTHFQKGSGPLPVAFQANGAVDLAVLSLVLDPDIHRISGRAAVRLDSSGTVAQPDLAGVFELLNTHYENTLTGTLLTDVQMLLRSRGTRVDIEEARARSRGGGRLEASGSINWYRAASNNAVNLELTARNVQVIDREDLEGQVSGDLSLTGSFDEMWLRGDAEVSPLAANIDAALQSQIPEIEVTEVYDDPAELEEDPDVVPAAQNIAPTINLDLTVTAEQQAYLRGRGLEAELAGEIHLGGTLANPNYEGEFNIVRGVFEVFGRKFTLDEGEVLFANNALYMRIPGEWEHEDYLITAILSGTVDELSLDLTSVPALPEDEILSLLIFGESAQEITPIQALRLASAVQTLRGGGGGFDPIGSTRDALGVDTLSIESATTESGTGVSVGVGKYLSDRVYLELRRSPSEVQPWQGSVEIELSPRLQLRSTTEGDGNARAEFLWTRDF